MENGQWRKDWDIRIISPFDTQNLTEIFFSCFYKFLEHRGNMTTFI